MMTNTQLARPIILVAGASAWQGGSVARQLLDRGRFAVRALTRDPDSHAARALRESGAEIAAGDLEDLGCLREALAGCYAAFASPVRPDQGSGAPCGGLTLVDAAADSGVGYLVFGAYPPVIPTYRASRRSLTDLGTRIETYARSLQIPLTVVTAAEYYERIYRRIAGGLDSPDAERLSAAREDGCVPGIAAADVAAAVAALFERRSDFPDAQLHLVGDVLTPWEYAVRMAPVAEGSRADPPGSYAGPSGRRTQGDSGPYDQSGPHRAGAKDADALRTRELYPEISGFVDWLVRRSQTWPEVPLPEAIGIPVPTV